VALQLLQIGADWSSRKYFDGVTEGPLHLRTDRVRRSQEGTGLLKSN